MPRSGRTGWVALAFVIATSLASSPLAAAEAPQQLHALFRAEWEYDLRESPTFASALGDRRWNDQWGNRSLEAIERRHRHYQQVLAQLKQFDEADLSPADRLNLNLFRREYQKRVEGYEYQWFLLPINQRGGIQTANELADRLRFTKRKDFEDWTVRLERFPAYMEQTIALLREGMQTGLVHPKIIMDRLPEQIRKQIVAEPQESLFYKPFREHRAKLSEEDYQRLAGRAQQAIRNRVVPAYRRLLAFVVEEYLPKCYDQVGCWQMPKGKPMYAARARWYTTTELTPEEIHELGLQEVARIRQEMQKVIEQTEFEGSFAEFLDFLRSDPQFYYDNPRDLLAAYRATAKRIDPLMVKLFRTMPRIPYGVEPIPANIAPDTTTAYYSRPAADGSRAGTYFVNLYRPETRPKYEMEALSLHEAVPGHHFQIALAMELGELPEFRRYGGFTAYVEGWGLYCETLGDELGLYRDPYSKFGQLTYEMWRAIRLVVDTGIHHYGWKRDRAIQFFKANAAKSELDIVNEIDRYIAWPGQALAYKIGQLKIRELRSRADKELGESFDVRDFHDVVLLGGAVPLDVLEANVNAWIEQKKQGAE